MQCEKCGFSMPEEAIYCPRCGWKKEKSGTQENMAAEEAHSDERREDDVQYDEISDTMMQSPNGNKEEKPERFGIGVKKVVAVLAIAAVAFSIVSGVKLIRSAGNTKDTQEPETRGSAETAVSEDLSDSYPDSDYRTGKNSGFYSLMGTVMHLDDQTYFVQAGLDNDCTENGAAYSEGIWRIGDDLDAEPELIYSVPANVINGSAQSTIVYLSGTDEKIWFLKAENGSNTEYSLNWVSVDGKESGKAEMPEHDSISRVDFDDSCYYIKYSVEMDNENQETNVWVFNVDHETSHELSFSATRELEGMEILFVNAEYAFFLSANDSEPIEEMKLFREELSSGTHKEIGSIDSSVLDNSKNNFYYANGKYFYYSLDQILYAVQIETGEHLKVLDYSEYEDHPYPSWCISEDGIWYLQDNGIWFCDLTGEDPSVVIEMDIEDCCGLSMNRDWLYYSSEDKPAYMRIHIDEQKETETALLVDIDRDTIIKYGETDQWLYTEYPAFIEVNGYTGEEETVKVPDEINGLPVCRINVDSSLVEKDVFTNTETLILPENAVTVAALEIPNLQTLELSSGIRFITNEVLTTDYTEGLILVYPDTLKKWITLLQESGLYYGGFQPESDVSSFQVNCTEGTYRYDNGINAYIEVVPVSVDSIIQTFTDNEYTSNVATILTAYSDNDVIWSWTSDYLDNAVQVSRFSDFTESGDQVYICVDSVLYVFDRETGEILWTSEQAGTTVTADEYTGNCCTWFYLGGGFRCYSYDGVLLYDSSTQNPEFKELFVRPYKVEFLLSNKLRVYYEDYYRGKESQCNAYGTAYTNDYGQQAYYVEVALPE